MIKPTSKNRVLARAVLSSTMFVTPLALATTFGPGNTVGPILTSAQPDNIVEVVPQGTITVVAGNAVSLDSLGGTIITDPNGSAVATGIQSNNGAGISISASNGIVDIGAGTFVSGNNGSAISNFGGDNTFISNSGYLSNTGTGVIFIGTANNTLNNYASGTIVQSVSNFSALFYSGTNLNLINSGNIAVTTAANLSSTLNIQNSFDQIVNNSGGIIQNLNGGVNAHAIEIAVGAAGTSGDIINEAGGLIYTNGTGPTIIVSPDTSINILNAGKIQSAGNAGALQLSNDINSLINSGAISSASASTIVASANVNIPGMIINSGNITNETPGNIAIDLNSFNPVSATFVQNGGTVTGNVLLAQLDSQGGQNVFFMNGGTILGNVETAAAAATLALQGGTIAGNVNGKAAAQIFNLSGTHVLGILNGNDGNDEFNVTEGSYGSIDGGNGLDILNFDRTFTSKGFITNVESINVNAGLLTLNNQIINMGAGAGGTGLIIDPGASLILNAGISGQNNITNNGTFYTNSAQVISLTGIGTFTNNNGSVLHLGTGAGLEVFTAAANGFTSATGSIFEVDLGSATQHGHLIVNSQGANSINFNNGSVIAPKVKGFISQGAVFDIVRNIGAAGTILDNSSLTQTSAVVQFTKSPSFGNLDILLTARRNPYEIFAIDPTQGLASALDFAARGDGPSDPNLAYLMGQIDGLSTASEVSDALIALTPPANNALVQASFTGMNSAFERINERMYDMHLWMQQQAELNSGVNSGDKFGVLGFWAQALGAHLNQHERDGLDGYDANSGGLALGVDWRYNDCTALGFAISYNKAKVNDHEANPKDENIRSWQGTTYAWIDYANGMYINAIMGLAFNDYDVDRTIRFNQINTVSNGNFNGWQFGLQTDAGWFLINNNDYFVTPFARLKYTLLSLDNYTETGAGPLSLRVDNQSIDQLLGGMGVKFGKPFTSKHLVFIPEVTTLVSYDFVNDGEQSTSSFVGNSLEFATNGIKPGRAAFDLGVGVSTHIDEQSIFTIKYDLELRDKFNANSAYLEYYYLWG